MNMTSLLKDSEASAEAIGLRYLSENTPGYARKLNGKGYMYFDTEGQKITDEKVINRLDSLGVPPAYTNVWLSPYKNSHLQATGVNEKGKKQYIYHADWIKFRTESNHLKMIEFGQKLPLIRRKVKEDLEKHGLVKEKILATIVSLLDQTLIRVGNEASAQENEHYGLTTMRNKHVKIQKNEIQFTFQGKSGKNHAISVQNKKLSAIVKKCIELPGWELFQYVDKEGNKHSIESADVNEYLKELSGITCSAKDFRTWWGTVYALVELGKCELSRKKNENKKNITAVVKSVSKKLGNTPTVCRKHYIYPKVFDQFSKGKLQSYLDEPTPHQGLSKEECCALGYLKKQIQQ